MPVPNPRIVLVSPTNSRHAMASTSTWSSVAILSLLLLIMAASTGEGRARRVGKSIDHEGPFNYAFDDEVALGAAATVNPNNNAVVRVKAAPRSVTNGNGCYSCVYRGYLFPEQGCQIEQCPGMVCYKVTAFVEGAASGSPPWVAHGCTEPSVIDFVQEQKAECQVLRKAAEKLDPNGGPAHGTTFNRCAIHTCENYGDGKSFRWLIGAHSFDVGSFPVVTDCELR